MCEKTLPLPYRFGSILKNPFNDVDEGDWIEIDAPGHGGFMLVVWRIAYDERSPECEAAAIGVLAALNASVQKDPS